MWNRISGKSSFSKDDSPSQNTRRNHDEQRQSARHSGSIASSNSNRKTSSRAEDRDPRGFNPTSTSYSSTTREQYPGAASASIASSYATASGNSNGEPYVAPGLVRNASLADQMPKSSSSRSSRGQNGTRETRDGERDETAKSDSREQDVERRHKRDKRDKKDKSLRRSENGFDEEAGTSRGPDTFPDQVASSGFSQFPGQYDGAIPTPNGVSTEHPAMSSHVQDQFPGQFPTQSSAPYRPPLAASEGGPGLAAEYYGDDGQSVAEQPGNRANTPSLIIGAEPHLQAALAVAAPPPEPSASGGVGAAASFFSGEFEGDEAASNHGQQSSSTYVTGQIRPNSSYHSSSAPVIPTIGGAAIGSTASHFIDSHSSSHQYRPDHDSPTGGPSSEYSTIMTHPPPSQTQDTNYSSTSRPPKPGKQSSQSSNTPIYAAGVGAAGLAAAAYEHSSNQHVPSTPHYSTTSMAQRHRNHGPFRALVDFFKDPEGVAQFEEYSQIIGVCRYCFAPGSSPRDAPRKHFHGRRRSNERYGSSTRVDKDSRYYSSENEGRRKNKSWLATGLAGYGLAKVGESLFKEKDDFGDTYSGGVGRFSPDGRDRRAGHRSRSKERVGSGIIGDGKSEISNDTKKTTYSTRRHSRTRSTSSDRKNGLTEAAIGAALGTSMVAPSSRRQSHSPQGSRVKSKHTTRASSSERRRKTKKKKKRDKGFFSFGNGSSSSSSTDLAYGGSQDKHRSSRVSPAKSREDKKAEAALIGLGAAAAALALKDGRQSHRKKGVKENVGMKETKDHHRHSSTQANRSKESSGNLDDELWESAAEDDYQSVNSDLAYGAPRRRDSRASLSSDSSGTNKWGWRWGSNKNRRTSSPRRKSSDRNSISAIAGTAGPGLTSAAITYPDQRQGNAIDSASSLPLQHVYPVPTSDPSRFDVDREDSIASSNRPVMSSRPEAVPIQHPRPRAPVSAAIYSSQTAYDHSYSAPTGPAVFSQTPNHPSPGTYDARSSTHEASIPGIFPRFEQPADDMAHDFKIRRRDTSPARIGEDSISSTMAPRLRTSAIDDSGVRFDLTEEQQERDRRERRRKRKQDKERREAEEQDQIERERRASKEYPSKKSGTKTKPEEGHKRSSEKAWIGPAAAGVIGAAIGVAAAKDRSNSEETREERRERRRRERELEDEEEALSRSERRRKQRERDEQEAAIKERRTLPDEASASSKYADHQGHSPEKQDMSIWQEAASTKRSSSHEDYGAFFTPLEFLNKSNDQVKITSANADADIDLEQVPQIVTVEPKRIHDLSKSPAFSPADTDDQVDSSKLSFPWLVPKLRLVEPTPPSTRGSTPIPQPRDAGDEGFEEPRKEPSPSKVRWADDQTNEYTIIAPKEDHVESIEPPSEKISGTGSVTLPRSTHEGDLSDDETKPHIDSVLESNSASYGEDAEFAATLAASAEDAGFDPSIVISNPMYRRRDSPPGSSERSMPGGFDDEDKPPLNKKERNRKEKASRRRNQNDGPNQRDDDAVVQDIISQVEQSESQPSNQIPSETIDNEWESTKKSKSKKSKKGRKGSEPQVNLVETSEFATKPLGSESRDVYQSPTVDLRSTTSNALTRNEVESGSKSHNKSTRDSASFDDAASAVSSQITTEASKDFKPKSRDKGKGSIWNRFLGKSNGSLPQEDGSEDVIEEVTTKDFYEPKKKSKKSKERKSTPQGDDDHDSKERDRIAATNTQISGRISQDLPAKDQETSLPSTILEAGSVAQYLDHGTELEQSEDKLPESFLGMRPDPPPPPDTRAESERFNPLKTTSLPNSPRSESDAQIRRFSDAEISNPIQTPAALPSSPTAVPFHFRQPYRSSSTARSLSQTPLSSNRSVADPPPKQKIRPRSTEFKSSTEIRPLWLVERHRSHQEPIPDENYPSLPSSHTTSRSSSVHNVEGNELRQNGDYELKETDEPTEVELGPMITTKNHLIQSDLLDSQQATPTASSFQDSGTGLDFPSPPATGDSSPKVFAEGNSQQSSSMLKNSVLGAVIGGSAALALNAAIQKNDPSPPDLSHEENVDFERGLDAMVIDTGTHQSDNDIDHQEDFIPQRRKKGKKKKRKASQFPPNQISVAEVVEATPSTKSLEPESLDPESMRQLQEHDAQDAVDTWSPSALPSEEIKKGKKGKSKALLERSPKESGPFPTTKEIPKDNLETAEPTSVQESDTLAPEMSREQIVHIMTAAAQDTKNENEASQSATAVFQGHSEIAQGDLPQDDFPQGEVPHEVPHEVRLEPQSQDDFARGNLPRDKFSQSPSNLPKDEDLRSDLLQDSLPALASPVPAKVTFMDPFLEQGHENVPESPMAPSASQTEFDRSDLTKAMSSPLELSPRATPLPYDDDENDLLDEGSETPAPTAFAHFDGERMETAADSPIDVPLIHDSSAMTPGTLRQSQDLAAQTEQFDTNDYFAALSKNNSKHGTTANEDFPVEDSGNIEIQEKDGQLPVAVSPTALEDEWPKDLNDETAMDVSKENHETVGDAFRGFTSKGKGRKGKKAKQSFSVENSKTVESQEGQASFPEIAASEAREDREVKSLIDESAFDVPQSKFESPKDEWTGFNSKKKGRKGKKGKPSFSIEDNKAPENEGNDELLSNTTISKASESYRARDMIDDNVTHAPKSELIEEEPKASIHIPTNQTPKPEVVENNRPGFDNDSRGEQIERQESRTLDLGLGSDETEHQLERRVEGREEMNDRPSSLATTGTSQEVSDMLRLGETEDSIAGESKEAFPVVYEAEDKLHKSSEDQIYDNENRSLPVAYESAILQFGEASGKPQEGERSPTLDTSVASTDAARDVQNILAVEGKPTSSADAKREATVASTNVEGTATDITLNDDGLDWDAPKRKKKGKKGKKTENSLQDEPKTIESAEVLDAPGAMDTSLVKEPAEENEVGWDAPQKKRKGKKGKKSELFSLDEPDIIGPVGLSVSSGAMEIPRLEEELSVKAIDEVSSGQFTIDEKDRNKIASRTVSDFRDENEPNDVPTETPGQGIYNARDLPAIASDFRDDFQPDVVSSEPSHETGRVEDRLAVATETREEVRPSVIGLSEAPRDDDKIEDRPKGGIPPVRAESGAPGDVAEPAVPTELAQDNENGTSREAPLEQEQDFRPPKSKRDKKKSKKSKKPSPFSVDDDETLTTGDGQISAIKNSENDEPEQMIPFRSDAVEESEKTARKTQIEEGEDSMPFKNKKDKKKSKRSKKLNTIPLDKDISPTLEYEPVSNHEDVEKEAREQTLPSSVDEVEEPETFAGGVQEKVWEETKEAQPFEGQTDVITAQSEQEIAPQLNEGSEIDSKTDPPNASGDPVVVVRKGGEPVHGYLDSVSAHAPAFTESHKASSSVMPPLEQPVDASEMITANQANDLQENFSPAVGTDTDPRPSFMQNQKDEERPHKTRPLIWEEDEASQEPRAVFEEFSVRDDSAQRSDIHVSQDSKFGPRPKRSAQEIESTEIVQPGLRSEEDQGFQESFMEEQPSRARSDVPTVVEAESDESIENIREGKEDRMTNNEKLSILDPEEDWLVADGREHASVTATRSEQENKQTSEQQPRDDSTPAGELGSHQGSTPGVNGAQSPILTELGAIDEAKDKEAMFNVPVQDVGNTEKQHDEVQRDGSGVEETSSSVVPQLHRESGDTARNTEPFRNVEPLGSLDKDKLIPAVEVESLDAQEQQEYNKKYAHELERAFSDTKSVADLEPVGGPDIDKPIPAVEIEMLDAQEQREYNEEYAKELERQLSPLQEGERGDPSRDEADTPKFSQSSITPVMERPYEEEYRPLARPPALEDIIEESGSRSGSVQGSPVGREDNFPPMKSTKKSKKGKKGKKQQPIIWEDETATPSQEPSSDQGVEPFITSLEDPGVGETDNTRRLDSKPTEQRSLEDRISASPIGGSNAPDEDHVINNDSSSDYFAIQPSRPAETDVGTEYTREFRQALSMEPPYSTNNRSPAWETQTAQAIPPRDDAVNTDNQDEELGPVVTDFRDKSRTEAEPAEKYVNDHFEPAPIQSKNEGKKSRKKASARELNPQALGSDDLTDRPREIETRVTDTMEKRSPSRRQSSQPPLHEDERLSVAEGSPTSRSRSGSMGGVVAVLGLGVSALAAEKFTTRDSNQEEGHSKKAKEDGRWTDLGSGIGKSESPLGRKELLVKEQEHRQTPESGNAVSEWQHQQATPPQSPPSASYEAIADHPVVEDLAQSSETPQNRDSAICVSGSPMISEEIPYHRAARDSGYPDTEASPVKNDEFENLDDPMEVGSGVAAGERIGRVHSRTHESERQSSTSRNPFDVSVEASSDYDVSVSRPKERRKRSKRRSGAAYDSDDSADSGFDIQRRRRRQAMAGEPREPSPVSSTTKDRSSALFDSSPSARGEAVVKVQGQDASSHYDPVREEPTWSFDHETPPQQRSRVASRERESGSTPEHALESIGYEDPAGQHEDAGMSRFGGPQSNENDSQSLARSPPPSEIRGRQRLNTISEDSADGSPVQKKDKRAMSDVGSPESGVKGRRMRSPSVGDDVAGEYESTYDPVIRPSWPAADEEKHAVEERSRSRNSEHSTAFSSRQGALPDVTPRHKEGEYRTGSAASMQSEKSIHAIIRTPDQFRSASGLSYSSSGTPPLRRVDRSASGDLRGASRRKSQDRAKNHTKSSSEFEAEPEIGVGIPSSSTYDPITDKGKSRANMADVYEGWGDVRGQSPMSPTRPPSMRKRQSMQLLDLETRLDQMVSENRLLASQKLTAERALQEQARDYSQERRAYEEAMQEHKMYLKQKDSELSELKQIIEQLHDQAAHLTEVNGELATSRGLDEEHQQRYSQLQAEHASTHEQWQQSTRELESLKEQHTQLSSGMEDIVRHEVNVALEEKNLELRQLQNELENAKQQVRDLQQQLLASRNSDDFVEQDEDYFDSRCQSLCQHVQQWVLRFSKFSDMKACYLASEIRDEKIVDRMENAILDGSDVDDYLSDRVKRRDVFMSVVMTMIWEFIFTRYLFGMDREQRQKLKNLEKTLQEVGPMSAVHKWRATTLTLLMKREAFENQRATDTEAVVHEIYDTLATFLPPPSHLVGQIQDSLRKVIDTAVDLSIEMRTQRAEYSMLPPLQPEYDTNGDLARKVYFSALTMNERSGATSSNEALQEQHAVVKMVLFPLVVKNEEDDEQIVVCPAQVLTAEGSKGKKTVRVMSAQGGSEASFSRSDVRMEGGMI